MLSLGHSIGAATIALMLTSDITTAELYETARAAWPTVSLEEAAFARYLAARPSARENDGSTAHAAELYPACACARGDPAAIEAFDKAYLGDLDLALRALGAPAGIAGTSDRRCG